MSLNIIAEEINNWKEMEGEAKEIIESFLLRVLKEADDVRKKGVNWVLSKLHSFNCDYNFNDLPAQLDETSKKYLLSYVHHRKLIHDLIA